jgi:hypothetical protein
MNYLIAAIVLFMTTLTGTEAFAQDPSTDEATRQQQRIRYQELDAALLALRTVWRQQQPDAELLLSHTAQLKQRLTVFCEAYSATPAEQEESSGSSLTAKQSAQTVAPQPVVAPDADTGADKSGETRTDVLDQTHRAPDPEALRKKIGQRTAAGHCRRALEELDIIEAGLQTGSADRQSLAAAMAELENTIAALGAISAP